MGAILLPDGIPNDTMYFEEEIQEARVKVKEEKRWGILKKVYKYLNDLEKKIELRVHGVLVKVDEEWYKSLDDKGKEIFNERYGVDFSKGYMEIFITDQLYCEADEEEREFVIQELDRIHKEAGKIKLK